jgi:NCS1 family nucleobase:cation symporter-1
MGVGADGILGRLVEADKPWSIEQHGIDPIPAADRHGSPQELFRMWIGANVNYVVVLTGALAVTRGLSLWAAIAAVLLGNLLGCAVLGLASIMGPRTGTAGIVTSRVSFGQLGAFVPIAASTVAALGWFSINSVVATQSLEQVLHLAGLPDGAALSWASMLVVLVAEILLAIYGHATIVAAEKWLAVLLLVLFAGGLYFVLGRIDWAHAAGGARHPASTGDWLLVLGLVFSYPISWTNFASDYSRYLPARTSWWAIVKSAGGGQFVALVFCEIIGVFFAMAAGGTLADPVSDLPKLLPSWFILPFLLAVILGSVASNVPNGYTSGLGLLALRIPIRRVTSLLVIAIATLAFRVATLLFGHFFDLYQQWLGYIILWTCPWVAIVVVEHFLRGGQYDARDLMRWGAGEYWYRGGVHWPGLAAFCIGLAASVLFSNSDIYASPLMTDYLGGADLSFEAGVLGAGLAYYLLSKSAHRARN